MLNHIFLLVSNLDRSIAFYTAALASLGIINRLDYDGKDDPAGLPNLKGFGAKGRIFFWLRRGAVAPEAMHIGFAAVSKEMVNLAYAGALKGSATSIHPPKPQSHDDHRYYTTQVRDLDGYNIEFIYKSWQHWI